MTRAPLTTLAATSDVASTLEVLLAGGERKKLSDAERRDLLTRVRAGEHVELAFRARTYVQGEEPNRSFVRFKPTILAKLAKSFAGQPFLRDHGQRSLDDRGGTISSAELVTVGDDQAIEMEITAVKPWAVEGLLDRTIDRFSIGWHPTGEILCSVHKKALRGADGCRCWPGEDVDGKTVQAVFTGADGLEVSAVNVPAVAGARGVEIRAALSAWVDDQGQRADAREENIMVKIAALLGLATAASEDEILPALTRLKDERDALVIKLGAEQERGAAVAARLLSLEAEKRAVEEAATLAHVDSRLRELKACGALALSRDVNGEPAQSNGERMLRAAAKRGGIPEFEAAAADFVPGTFAPSGAPRQLSMEKTEPGSKNPLLANPEVRRILKATGVTDAQVEQFNGLGMFAERSE